MLMNDSGSWAALPTVFCWTRFGTEAGEPIERILKRKEAERQANGGMFCWGIGNSIAPAMTELLERIDYPELLFSPIKSRPRKVDVSPPDVVRWTTATDLWGSRFDVPAGTQITSRWNRERPRLAHYALVCASAEPLRPSRLGRLSVRKLRNLCSGAPPGASQVTAVVSRSDESEHAKRDYTVVLRARLVTPYFIRLGDPVPVACDRLRPAGLAGTS